MDNPPKYHIENWDAVCLFKVVSVAGVIDKDDEQTYTDYFVLSDDSFLEQVKKIRWVFDQMVDLRIIKSIEEISLEVWGEEI